MVSQVRIVYESTARLAIRWQLAGGCVFETFDDGLESRCQQVTWDKGGPGTLRTVLPEPFQPTMRVRGVLKMMVSPILGPKERTLGLSVSSLWLLIQLAILNAPLDVQAFDFGHDGGSWTLAATHA